MTNPRGSARPPPQHPWLSLSSLGLLVGTLLVLGLHPARALANSHLAHYLVFEIDPDGSIQPVFHRLVELAAPARSMSETELNAARSRTTTAAASVALRLRDAAGQIVFRDHVQVPEWIRGEFAGEARGATGSKIDAYHIANPRRVFVARVPAEAGGQLILDGSTSVDFDLDALVGSAGSMRLSRALTLHQQSVSAPAPGPPSNRADLLIMGDGYTAGEMASFLADANNLESDFFNITPYGEYRNYVNVINLFTASAESGADHPPYDGGCGNDPSCCADTAMLSDPLAGTFVDTAFNARYCTANSHRLLVVDTGLILAAASAAPDWDEILVLVNDGTYGGSGGFLAVTSVHPAAVDIARHEYGHSFSGLADEYDTAVPGHPGCSDVSGPPCEANVTDETSSSLIKWSPWILPSTPIPTPEGNPSYTDLVGLFEGARYLTTGMYRPRDQCLMRFLGASFGEICRQAYVLRLYEGGWGVPTQGIDPIEPGSEDPPIGIVSLVGMPSVTLSVELLEPVGGPPLDVAWLVDGVPVPGADSDSFTFMPPGEGSYEVDIQVEDVTPLVHSDMAGTALQSARTWTVEAEGIVIEGCLATPLMGCLSPGGSGKSQLQIKDQTPAGPGPKDKVQWKWLKGPGLTQADFGDPTDPNGPDYKLCVYAGSAPALTVELLVPAGGTCVGKPCWKAISTKGYKYGDKTQTSDGVKKLILKGDVAGKSKILIQGKDENLPLPTLPLDPNGPVIAQLSSSDPNLPCYEEIFSQANVTKNEAKQFKAKTP